MAKFLNKELKILLALVAVFLGFYFLPIDSTRFQSAVIESLRLVKWYAQEHVLLCLVPAFFIAGAIGVFVSQNAVMKYFGPKANKLLSYGVASISGTILAVCSCTVLPLFGGIYMRGAGLGPAIAFLYSGPAINILAIVLTARILGWQLGLARAVGAIFFSVVIGLLMHFIFLKEERVKSAENQSVFIDADDRPLRPLWQTGIYFLSMVAVLVFANWAKPNTSAGFWLGIYTAKWTLTAIFGLLLSFTLWRFLGVKLGQLVIALVLVTFVALVFSAHPVVAFTCGSVALAVLMFFNTRELKEWGEQTWGFAKQITPLLFGGVLVAGFFLGSPASPNAGIVPSAWIQALVGNSPATLWRYVGGNPDMIPGWLSLIWPIWTNLFASCVGVFMYFATLTEVPILRGLIDSGMGQGPALALLLSGPAVSLPSMLVISSIIGPKKMLTYVALVVVMSTITGVIFGAL